jgi:hypothetical protein
VLYARVHLGFLPAAAGPGFFLRDDREWVDGMKYELALLYHTSIRARDLRYFGRSEVDCC